MLARLSENRYPFKRTGKTDIYMVRRYLRRYLRGTSKNLLRRYQSSNKVCKYWEGSVYARCNTSQYTPLQALSPRRRAAARIPSWTCLGDLRKSVASDINIHVSNPRVPSPASKALALALKTKEAHITWPISRVNEENSPKTCSRINPFNVRSQSRIWYLRRY